MEICHNAVCEGIAGHAKVSLRMVHGAEPSGVIFQRVTLVGDGVAQTGRSTGIRLHSLEEKIGIGKTRQLCKIVIKADQIRKKRMFRSRTCSEPEGFSKRNPVACVRLCSGRALQ